MDDNEVVEHIEHVEDVEGGEVVEGECAKAADEAVGMAQVVEDEVHHTLQPTPYRGNHFRSQPCWWYQA